MSADPEGVSAPKPTLATVTRVEWPLLVLIGAVLFMALAPTAVDADLWGHLRFGQDTLALGIVRDDPYSYLTAPGAWVNHEWLAEVTFALAYDALGVLGLALLRVSVALGTLAMVFGELHRRGQSLLGPTVVTSLATLGMLPALRQVRPQLYTALLMAGLLLVLAHYERGRRRLLAVCVPVMGLWANLHGGVLAGAGVLVIWYVARVSERAWRQRAAWRWRAVIGPGELVSVLLSLLAILATPYGATLPSFLLQTATVARPEIQDWQPATLSSYYGLTFLASAAMLGVAWFKGRKRPSTSLMAVTLALAALALCAARHVALFALAVALVSGPTVVDLLASRRAQVSPRATRAQARGQRDHVLAATAVALAIGAVGYGAYQLTTLSYSTSTFPAGAVRALVAAKASGQMVTPYNWGEYVIWHAGPTVQVSMDGRRETVYDDTVYRENLAWYYGLSGWRALIDRGANDLVLTEVGSPSHNLMPLAAGWTLVYTDDTAALWARTGSSLAAQLQKAADSSAQVPQTLPFP